MRVALTVLLFLSVTASIANADTYRIALRYIPTEISPFKNQINTNHYILLHLYFPLIVDDGGVLSSEFLDMAKTLSQDDSFTNYKLCLKKNIRFSDDVLITTEDLKRSIKRAHLIQETLPRVLQIASLGTCVLVRLEKKDTRYLHRFSGVASTVLKEGGGSASFPVGLGPYKMLNHDTEKIVLTATRTGHRPTFDKIEFLKWKNEKHLNLEDLNHIYPRPSAQNLSELQKVQTPTFKVYSIIVNLRSPALRKQFASCFNQDAFRKAVRPDLVEASGFLPNGLFGADIDYGQIKASFGKCKDVEFPRTDFIVLLPEDVEPAKNIVNQLPISIKNNISVKTVSSKVLAEAIFDRKPKIVMLGFDSSGSTDASTRESSIFFESFIRSERVVAQPPERLRETIKEASLASDSHKKNEFYRKAHRILLESAYIVPLGQVDNVQFYPKKLRNIEWADRLSGFPSIQKMTREAE